MENNATSLIDHSEHFTGKPFFVAANHYCLSKNETLPCGTGSLNIFLKDGLPAGFYFTNTLLNLPANLKKAPYITAKDMCVMISRDIFNSS